MTRLAPLLGGALLSACTYGIVLDAGGQGVTTDWSGQRVGGCRDIGKVTVSVMSRVGPVDRNDIKVRDELEIMARNQAAQMHADTVTPLGDPRDGEQSWEAYSCGTVAPQGGAPGATPQNAQGSGAPVEEVPPPSNAPPPSNYPPTQNNAPQPFSAPLPAGSSAQTYPMSGSSS
ncbi:MAG: DUF4156 domain-containing protein [Proteobacteria bacterium]|nr:DUF4156 domain-containing protein [Pseudomonadota bacterium]